MDKWLYYIKNRNLIKEEEIKIIKYSLEVFVLQITFIGSSLFIGTSTNKNLEVIIFLSFLIPLRSFSGGYHADKKLKCLVLSLGIIVAFVRFIEKIEILSPLIILVMLIAKAVIILKGPLVSKNKPLSKKERMRMKKILATIVTIELIIFFIAYFQGYQIVVLSIFSSFVVAIILLFIPEKSANIQD